MNYEEMKKNGISNAMVSPVLKSESENEIPNKMNAESVNNDDLYFKDCFTEVSENVIDAEFNKLTISCMASKNGKFSLDSDGNLTVNSITAKNNEAQGLTFDQIYPVGSIYISVNSTNPASFFGGKWENFGSGKTLIGVDSSQSEFNTVQKTGGAKSHNHSQGSTGSNNGNTGSWSGTSGSTVLTVEQVPEQQIKDSIGRLYGSHDGIVQENTNGGWWRGIAAYDDSNRLHGDRTISTNGGGKGHTHSIPSHTHTLNNHTHTNPNTDSSSNLPPYITVYFWRRTE